MIIRKNALKEIYKNIDKGTPKEKMESLPKFPRIIELEITNHCNFQCIMCPTGVGTAKRERGYMTDEVFYKALDEIALYGSAIKFVGQGESLLHPQAIRFFCEAKNRGIVTHLTTNGSLLTEEMMKEIVNSACLDSIKFSFQGIDPKGYEILRQKDGFDDLMGRISQLYKIRGDRNTPFITIGTSITNEPKEDIDAFIEQGEKVSDKVEIGITNLESSNLSLIKSDSVRSKLVTLQENQTTNKKRYVCCPQVYDTIALRWNGDITACCADVNGLMTLGNIKKVSISDCWNGEKETAYRKILAELRYDDIETCRECYDVYGWTYGEN